jgi:Asp-tRNA(Asn)/Glu-tRNA(Gln) amidotransferase A subunit family amidase
LTLDRLFCDLSLAEMRKLRQSGDLTLQQVAEAMLSQSRTAERYSPWRIVDFGTLLERCDDPFVPSPFAADVLPELWDVPFAAKDVFNSRRFGVEKGSRRWIGYRAGNNARVIDHAQRRGCVLVGMSRTSEFAVDQESLTLNPHDTSRTPGTSSAGSAVACALGLVPFALGTQSGGSIIRPASFSGTVGMKPSFGLIPRTGALKTSDSLDTVGYFVSRVDSLRSVLTALRVTGRDYPIVHSMVDPCRSVRIDTSALRVAVVKTPLWEQCHSDVRGAIEAFVRLLSEVSATVEDLDIDSTIEIAHEMHADIYNASLAYHLSEDFDANPEDFSEELHARMSAGRSVTKDQYVSALDYQQRMASVINREFSKYDLVVTIATSTPAPARGEQPQADPSLIWTMAGVPAVAIPLGFSAEGLPIGVQLTGAKYSDYRLIACVEALARDRLIVESSLPIAERR